MEYVANVSRKYTISQVILQNLREIIYKMYAPKLNIKVESNYKQFVEFPDSDISKGILVIGNQENGI